MNDVTQLIDKDFQAFINEANEYNFFVGLADYVNYVKRTEAAKPVIDELERQWRREYDELDRLEEKTLQELQKPVDEVLAQKQFCQSWGQVYPAILRLESLVNRQTKVIMPTFPEAIADALFSVISSFRAYPHIEPPFLQSYKNKSPRLNGYDGNKFSETLLTFIHQNEILKDNSTLWFAWHKLAVVYSVLYGESRNEMVEAGQNENLILPTYQAQTISDYQLIAGDWNRIKNPISLLSPSGDISSAVIIPGHTEPAIVADDAPYYYFLILEKFRLYAKRFHSHLLHELAESERFEPIAPMSMEKHSVNFDSDKSILCVDETNVKIKKFSDQYHCLRIIFADNGQLSEEWFFSKIAEAADRYKSNDKTYYNAMYQIKLKVKASAHIEDLFLTTAQSVKINSKYIDQT